MLSFCTADQNPLTQSQDITLRIKAGDKQAFEEVFRRCYEEMCGYASRYLEDEDEAEEIVQEVFFNYWNKKETLDIVESLEGYLFRSVRNACLNHLKHMQVRTKFVQQASLNEEENSFSNSIEVLELQERIESCICRLPPERKKIFKLSREEGLKYREIAAQLGLSIKTVETQMGKALKFLRENLTEYLPVLLLIFLLQLVYELTHYF